VVVVVMVALCVVFSVHYQSQRTLFCSINPQFLQWFYDANMIHKYSATSIPSFRIAQIIFSASSFIFPHTNNFDTHTYHTTNSSFLLECFVFTLSFNSVYDVYLSYFFIFLANLCVALLSSKFQLVTSYSSDIWFSVAFFSLTFHDWCVYIYISI
jgi:hypothetical protein